MKKCIKNPVFWVANVTIILLTVWVSYSFSGNKVTKESKIAIQQDIESIELPDKLSFASEEVPLQNFDVREALDREILINTYWHSQTLIIIKKSKRYFAVIEPILEKNNIPSDFKYLPVAETGLANLVSPADAAGIWQFLDGTAKDYGLEINKEVDERYNFEKATEAACKFLNQSYGIYKNWTLVAASYNMGRKNINKQIKRQKIDYYYDLLLGDETGRYVFRLLALKLIIENPSKYGFTINDDDYYPVIPTYRIKVDEPIKDLAEFSIEKGINYKILKLFNPWMRENYLPNKTKKTYEIIIPEKGSRDFDYSSRQLTVDTLGLEQ